MARKKYRVTYGPQARRTLADLLDAAKAAVRAKEKELERDPHHAGAYDQKRERYEGTLPGGKGTIVYSIEEGYVTVYVIDVGWL